MRDEAVPRVSWPRGSSLELQFLLALIGRQSAQREEIWRELLPRVSWPQILDITHPDLYPYFHFCLQTRVGAAGCPPEVMRQLAASRNVTALRNLRRVAQLREIQTALATHNIPIIVLKGMVLAFVAYKDLSLRPMHDLDLFLHERNAAVAAQILGKLGYTCPNRLRGVHFEGEIKLQKTGTQSLVELHTQIEVTVHALPETVDDVWNRSVKTQISDFEVHILDKQDFLFHLCLHMARRHCYKTGLLALIDVLMWVEAHDVDWEWPSLIPMARARNCDTYVELTLALARDVLAAPIPPSLGSNLSDLTVMKDIAWQLISDDRRLKNFVPIGLVDLLNTGSVSKSLRVLLKRFKPEKGHARRSGARVAGDNFRALLLLLRALRFGNLSPPRVRREIYLQQQSDRLAALLRGEA